MNLSQRVEASSYLWSLFAQFPEYQPYVSGEQVVALKQLDLISSQIVSCEDELVTNMEAFTVNLREQKNRFTLLWSLASFSDALSFEALGQAQSNFAMLCAQQALNAAMHSPRIVKLYAGQALPDATENGLFVLAMGKLGGFDLNFSSDIDLVAFYDKERFSCPRMQGATFVVTQILQAMTQILVGNGDSELIWRVDWRLRPHASLRNLSMPTLSADDFYHYHAQPWHRLAMIKARPIAGDLSAGKNFLDDLSSFLWRHDLDYRALDDLESLKHKINREHPELEGQRRQSEQEQHLAKGYNLKLGTGGIREIEFIVNALQLIWGGRKPELRQTNTLNALTCLVNIGLYHEQAGRCLGEAYQFYRLAENALQMMENSQRYHLPEKTENQHKLLILLGLESWSEFEDQLLLHRSSVSDAFANLFADKRTKGEQAPVKEQFDWDNKQLNEQTSEIVQLWKEGFRNYGVHESYASSLKALAKELDRIIAVAELDANEAIIKLDQFFHSLPPGGQYFRLLKEYPALLDKLIQPLLHSDAMAILLQQSPHIIDRFLEDCVPLSPAMELDTSTIFYTQDFETRLQNLRRLANEELYLVYLQYFNAELTARQFEASLSHLAKCLIEICLQVTCDELQLKESPIGVIGFGKLGMGAMMPMSDLDLVFLFDDIEDLQLASQFASKLTTVISTPMKQGRVYELDTRLRPSGKSGAATISLESFRKHQLDHTHTWSHLALVPANFVAGNRDVGSKFTQIKNEVLSKPRDLVQFKKDCLKMLVRIKKQRTLEGVENQFVSKRRSGGLSELEYLICCEAILQHQNKPLAWSSSFDELAASFAIEMGAKIDDGLLFMRDFQLEVRLFGDEARPLSELSLLVKEHIKSIFNVDCVEQAEIQMQSFTKMTTEFDQRFFKSVDIKEMEGWQEQQIRWH
ncbi:MAG: glutamate-ammonia-ligase adenylyltransferase [Saprospiraceae bacterium]|jgi:glutamate-ammonia-ligase adenylyltransferase